ncbi:ABC-2 type transporter-domain-containing protein [Paraphysoderma sedebokerense]|nr:ABC-2 type transporter-domain-containing protein [Paraphysoderma sedebokerense]
MNGQATTGSVVKQTSGFVHQDDVVLGTMTVEEAIFMSAKLRLPKKMSIAEKQIKTHEIIDMLGLRKCMHTPIGTPERKGISGGERKRTCMGMELVTNPSVLFCDEPTSGLDTFTAYAVVKLLSELAHSGRTVIATLHQPSSEIFHLIDDLYIMAEGEIMYYGEAEASIEYFSTHGYKCPQFSNPADYYFMDILNTTVTTNGGPFTATERIGKLLQAWKKSGQYQHLYKSIQHPERIEGVQVKNFRKMASFQDQFSVLFRRAFKNAMRNKLIVKAKFAQILFMSILMGLIFLQVHKRSLAAQIQDRTGALFFVAVNMVMSTAMGMLTVFFAEKQVFQREFGSGYYSLPAYFLTKLGVELPFQIILPFIFAAIFYWLVGFQDDAGKFLILAACTILLSLSGTAIGTLSACAFNSLNMALAIIPMLLLPLMIFSGLFVNSGNIPVFLDWIKYLSPMKYGFVAMVKNEFEGLNMCDPNNPNACVKGEKVITDLGLDDQGSIFLNIIVLICLWLALLIFSYLSLWRIIRSAARVDVRVDSKSTIEGTETKDKN